MWVTPSSACTRHCPQALPDPVRRCKTCDSTPTARFALVSNTPRLTIERVWNPRFDTELGCTLCEPAAPMLAEHADKSAARLKTPARSNVTSSHDGVMTLVSH